MRLDRQHAAARGRECAMHEVAIMQCAVELVLEHARRAHASRVRSVKLRIGELSGVCADALSLAFEVVTQGTIAEGAEFLTEEASGRELDLMSLEVE